MPPLRSRLLDKFRANSGPHSRSGRAIYHEILFNHATVRAPAPAFRRAASRELPDAAVKRVGDAGILQLRAWFATANQALRLG